MRRSAAFILALALSMSLTVTATQAQDKIVIGALLDLSGPTSVWGNAVNKGAMLAVEKINAAGGVLNKKLEFVSYDVKLSPPDAINAYNRLVDQDKAVAVVGPPVSNIGLSLAPVADTKKVPIVGSFIDPRVTTKADGSPQDFMFLMQPSSVQYSEILADYALRVLGKKKVAVFYDQSNAFSVSLIEPFVAYLEKNGGQVVASEVYKKGDKDFRTQLNKISGAGAEAMYLPNYVQDLVITLMQMDQIGMKTTIIGGLDFAPPFVSLMPDPKVADNVYFCNNYSDNEPSLKEAREAYKAKFGEEAINKAYLGYDKILIIADAIKRAGKADAQAIQQALNQTRNLQGTTGVITLSPKTHRPLGLSMVMYKIDKGNYKDLGRHVPESHKAD
jgi:branched-chain amino acid transport system substrate-binding protein